MIEKIKQWARKLKRDLTAIFIAAKDKRTPRTAKLLAIATAAYALSPIDLIPDFIPVLGYVDDLLIVPAGIALIVSMMPVDLMSEFRKAAELMPRQRANWVAGSVVIVIWIVLTVATITYWSKTQS